MVGLYDLSQTSHNAFIDTSKLGIAQNQNLLAAARNQLQREKMAQDEALAQQELGLSRDIFDRTSGFNERRLSMEEGLFQRAKNEYNINQQFNSDLSAAIGSEDPSQIQQLILDYPNRSKEINSVANAALSPIRNRLEEVMANGINLITSGQPDKAFEYFARHKKILESIDPEENTLDSLNAEFTEDPLGTVNNLVSSFNTFGYDKNKINARNYALYNKNSENYVQPTPGADGQVKIGGRENPDQVQNRITSAENIVTPTNQYDEFGQLRDPKEQEQLIKVQKAAAELAAKRQETEIKKKEQKRKEIEQRTIKEQGIETIKNTVSLIDRIETHEGTSTATGLRSIFWDIPGGDSADANALIDQLDDKAFVAEVEKLRGFGPLSNAEGSKLSQAAIALKRSQSDEQFLDNLAIYKKQLENFKIAVLSDYNAIYGADSREKLTDDELVRMYGGKS